jgi:hypothetical protein
MVLLLGDRISEALASVGVTEDRVTTWLGKPCKCGGRKEKINQVDLWARRVIKGKIKFAKEYLDQILGQE